MNRFFDSLETVLPATSLGDVHSMILHPARSSHRGLTDEERGTIGITGSLVRLSVGIEDAGDIVADLDRALHRIQKPALSPNGLRESEPCTILAPDDGGMGARSGKERVHKMDKLASYLLEHIQLDFSGVDLETMQTLLREDRSPISTALMTKLIEDKGEEELLIVLSDCLKDHIGQGIDQEAVKKQLAMYAEA